MQEENERDSRTRKLQHERDECERTEPNNELLRPKRRVQPPAPAAKHNALGACPKWQPGPGTWALGGRSWHASSASKQVASSAASASGAAASEIPRGSEFEAAKLGQQGWTCTCGAWMPRTRTGCSNTFCDYYVDLPKPKPQVVPSAS